MRRRSRAWSRVLRAVRVVGLPLPHGQVLAEEDMQAEEQFPLRHDLFDHEDDHVESLVERHVSSKATVVIQLI